MSVPMVMWIMDFTFLKALLLDVAFLVVIPVYTVIYNWGYDSVFPVPQGAIDGNDITLLWDLYVVPLFKCNI